jgi:hypothetical protein
MTGLMLGGLAMALFVAFGVVFMNAIKQVKVEERRGFANVILGVSALVGVFAFTRSPGILGGVLAGLPVVVALTFAVLYVLRGQSTQAPALAVGQPLIDFTAPNEQGEAFTLSSLAGKPVLLKFFRGHW